MNVRWTRTAQRHLDDIFNYIARDSERYAKRTLDRLTKRSLQIADYPHSGRKVPEYDADSIREVLEGSYRIVYQVKRDVVEVIAVIHGAMNFPSPSD